MWLMPSKLPNKIGEHFDDSSLFGGNHRCPKSSAARSAMPSWTSVEIGSAVYHWCINLGDAPIGKFTGKRMINRRGFGLPVQTSHNSVI